MPANNASLNWHDIRFTSTSGSLGYNTGLSSQQGTIGCWDYYSVPSWDLYSGSVAPAINSTLPTAVHGYYYVRYRDWMTTCTGAWSTPLAKLF